MTEPNYVLFVYLYTINVKHVRKISQELAKCTLRDNKLESRAWNQLKMPIY